MKFYILIFSLFITCCSSNMINIDNLNQRNYQRISNLKKHYHFIFETDTTLNYKNVEEVKNIMGEPTDDENIYYHKKSLNMLFLLDSILSNNENEVVKMMKWKYDSTDRYVFFLNIEKKWISIMNIYIANTVEF